MRIFICVAIGLLSFSPAQAAPVQAPDQDATIETAAPAPAQPKRRAIRGINLMFGFNSSKFDRSASDLKNASQESNTNFTTGLTMDFRIGEKAAFETGLLYESTGEKIIQETGATSTYESNMKLNYISMPILAKYFFGAEVDPTVFVRGGLKIAYFIDGKSDSINTRNGYAETTSNYVDTKTIETLDARYVLGTGFQFPFSTRSKVFVGLDYEHSLGRVNKLGRNAIYNQLITLTSGISL